MLPGGLSLSTALLEDIIHIALAEPEFVAMSVDSAVSDSTDCVPVNLITFYI